MKLTKSRDDVVIFGVLGGLGEYYNIDPTILRIGFVMLVFLNVFPLIPLYIVGALLMPEAPKNSKRKSKRHETRKRPTKGRRSKYEPKDKYEKDSSSKANDVDEDDWSDF